MHKRFHIKSLNNFFTVREISEIHGYEPIRYFLISSHYRSPINYSTDIIEQGKSALERLYNCREGLIFALDHAEDGGEAPEFLEKHKEEFITAMDDDLNTADALAAIFTLAKDINIMVANGAKKGELEASLKVFDELCDVLGILYNKKEENLDAEVEDLIEKRTEARKNKNWAEADAIRDKLKEMGIVLEDTAQGVKWSRI